MSRARFILVSAVSTPTPIRISVDRYQSLVAAGGLTRADHVGISGYGVVDVNGRRIFVDTDAEGELHRQTRHYGIGETIRSRALPTAQVAVVELPG
jgi:hypothetical protein